jgi:hypothetical protein
MRSRPRCWPRHWGQSRPRRRRSWHTLLAQHLLQAVVDFDTPAQPFAIGRRADRHDHELLHVGRPGSMLAAVHDVHHGHGQGATGDAAQVAIERQVLAGGRGVGHGQRDAQNGISAQPALVLGAVQLDHGLVDAALVGRRPANDSVGDLFIDRLDRTQNPLAAIALLVAVALLPRLMDTGRRAGGYHGPPFGAVIERYFDLHGRIAARIQNLAREHRFNVVHCDSPWLVNTLKSRCGYSNYTESCPTPQPNRTAG